MNEMGRAIYLTVLYMDHLSIARFPLTRSEWLWGRLLNR